MCIVTFSLAKCFPARIVNNVCVKFQKSKIEDEVKENPSKTKNRKHKVTGEKKRVITQADSSDDESTSIEKIQQRMKEEQMSRAEKVVHSYTAYIQFIVYHVLKLIIVIFL